MSPLSRFFNVTVTIIIVLCSPKIYSDIGRKAYSMKGEKEELDDHGEAKKSY